jgi:hypothetical protein
MQTVLQFTTKSARTWIVALMISALGFAPPAMAEDQLFRQPTIPIEQFRLEAIGYRLATANAGRCSREEMLTGLVLHDIGMYAAADRPTARDIFGFAGGFGILSIVPGSPAALAGLAVGDEIVAINGEDLSNFAAKNIRSRASYERVEKFVAAMDRALSVAAARLTVRRGRTLRDVALTGEPGCGGRPAFLRRSRAEAWSDGRYVAVTQRMIAFVEDDQELAFVVAHEMAHNMLEHSDRISRGSALLAQFGIGAGKMKKNEIAADAMAIELMARAGFDVTASERLLRRIAKLIPLDLGLTHPQVSRRIQIVNAAVERLRSAPTLADATG